MLICPKNARYKVKKKIMEKSKKIIPIVLFVFAGIMHNLLIY